MTDDINWDELDDDQLMAALEAAVAEGAAVSDRRREAARAAFTWRTVDAELAELLSVRLGVVSTVGLDEFGAMTRGPGFGAYRWNCLDQRHQLGDIVGIGARQNHGERNALRIDRELVLVKVAADTQNCCWP